MSAATDNRKWQSDGGALTRDQVANAINGPVASNAHLYVGCLVGQLYSDTATHPALYNYIGDGSMRCVGFCTLEADTTPSLPANSRPTRVIAAAGCLIDKNAGGGGAFSTSNLFGPAYGVDNQTCSALPSDGPCIGQFVGIDFVTGQPMILVDPITATAFAATSPSRRARLVSTTNLNLATTALTAIDSVTPAAGDIILVAGQSTASQNGLYVASSGAWQRLAGPVANIQPDMVVEVSEGTVWAHSSWKLFAQGAITVGTTNLPFYPKFTHGTVALSGGTATVTTLYVAATTSGMALTDVTAAAAVKGVLTAGAGSGQIALTGTTTDTVNYTIINW